MINKFRRLSDGAIVELDISYLPEALRADYELYDGITEPNFIIEKKRKNGKG